MENINLGNWRSSFALDAKAMETFHTLYLEILGSDHRSKNADISKVLLANPDGIKKIEKKSVWMNVLIEF